MSRSGGAGEEGAGLGGHRGRLDQVARAASACCTLCILGVMCTLSVDDTDVNKITTLD